MLAVGLAHDETCTTLGLLASNPASSCNEIYQHNIGSGYYWIKTDQGLHQIKCKMGLQRGGVKGGWMQVVDVNMTQDNFCPGAWRMITTPKKLCVGGVNRRCDSTIFYTKGVKFQHICSQTKSYQKDGQMHLYIQQERQLMKYMLMGSPRQHIWTYAVSPRDDTHCPCAPTPGPKPSAFVENNYYCECGNNVQLLLH